MRAGFGAVIGLCWPDFDTASARNNVRRELSLLKAALYTVEDTPPGSSLRRSTCLVVRDGSVRLTRTGELAHAKPAGSRVISLVLGTFALLITIRCVEPGPVAG